MLLGTKNGVIVSVRVSSIKWLYVGYLNPKTRSNASATVLGWAALAPVSVCFSRVGTVFPGRGKHWRIDPIVQADSFSALMFLLSTPSCSSTCRSMTVLFTTAPFRQ